MVQYNVTGMSCAACSARVEKAVSKVNGVTSCSVSLLTNSMGVEGSASPDDIIAAVKNAGYGASLKGASPEKAASDDSLKDTQTPLIMKRLIVSVIFTLILMYFSMGHIMWGWPLPSFFDGNHVAMGLVQLLLTVIVMVINQKFFISGFKSLWHKAPKYGHSRCARIIGCFRLQHLCAVCNDRCAGQGECRCCYGLYA